MDQFHAGGWITFRAAEARISAYHGDSWIPRGGGLHLTRHRFELLLDTPSRGQDDRFTCFRRIFVVLPSELAELCAFLDRDAAYGDLPYACSPHHLRVTRAAVGGLNEADAIAALRRHLTTEVKALEDRLKINVPLLAPSIPAALRLLVASSPNGSIVFPSYLSLSVLLNKRYGISSGEQAVKDCVQRLKAQSFWVLDHPYLSGTETRVLRLRGEGAPGGTHVAPDELALPTLSRSRPVPFVRADLAALWSQHQAHLRDLLAGADWHAAVESSRQAVGLAGDRHDAMAELEDCLVGLLVSGVPGGCRFSDREIACRMGWTHSRARRVIRRAGRLLGPLRRTGTGAGRILFPHLLQMPRELAARCEADSVDFLQTEGEPLLPWGPAGPRSVLDFPRWGFSREEILADLGAWLQRQRTTHEQELRTRAAGVTAHNTVERMILAWVRARGGSIPIESRSHAARLFAEDCGRGAVEFLRAVATLREGHHLRVGREGRQWRELALEPFPALSRGRAGFGVGEVWAQVEEEEGAAPLDLLAAASSRGRAGFGVGEVWAQVEEEEGASPLELLAG